jgi:N-methylhydantoinase A
VKLHVGTDVGGTFTDLWVRSDDGRTKIVKAPTTPDVITGILDAIGLASAALGLQVEEFCAAIERFGHGTTVGLNALLTGRTAKTAIITTAGFADTLEIGRLKRGVAGLTEFEVSDYLLRGQWPPVVPRDLVFEVPERVDRTGAVVQPLDEAEASAVIEAVALSHVDAVAICTLWATQNPSHELRLRDIVAARLPDAFVSVSHEVSPAVGEYARMATTAANAALGPVLSSYLERLRDTLSAVGMRVPVLAMTSAGGVVTTESLAVLPAAALFSGPAAGVISCQRAGNAIGLENMLTIDVGGTSFDVGVLVDSAPLMRSEITVAGADIRFPSIDVASIGAGGGSIAQVSHGALLVGPQSAGAVPGPACYGRGGTLPTATDADLVLGVFDEAGFGGGRMRLDADAATRAISKHVAEPLRLGLLEAAWGIRQVLDAKMSDLLRRVTIERGHDPREFTMFASGGSGPSHAWALCRDLGIETVVVPSTATVQSANGTGTSNLRRTAERPCYVRIAPMSQPVTDDLTRLADALQVVAAEVIDSLRRDSPDAAVALERSVALRFRGQAHHLDVALPEDRLDADAFAACLNRFEADYELLFGKGAAFREAGFEVIYARAIGIGRVDVPAHSAEGDQLTEVGTRAVVFDDPRVPLETAVYATEHPAAGQQVVGPCLVVYPGQTAVVPPGATAHTDEAANLHIKVGVR